MTMHPFPQMTPALAAFLAFDPDRDEGEDEEQSRLQALVEPGLYRAYRRMEIDADFTPENEQPETAHEILSPSGTYKLVVVTYAAGGFGRRQGRVHARGQEKPLALVNRNYGSFPFLFIEGHPNGHSYLVAGEDYQGQTVVELDTGRRRDFLPDDADKGLGFCWSDFTFDAPSQLLVATGCIWACPYEHRVYDFSDPMSGWPELEAEEMMDADDYLVPAIHPDGTLVFRQAEAEGKPVRSLKTLRREGSKLVLVSEEVTPEEQQERARSRKARAFDGCL